jgi:hypothetical protein
VSEWRDCVVVLMDLVGVKGRAFEGTSAATSLMRSFHDLVRREMATGLPALEHAYLWNDSVILLAHVTGSPRAYQRVIRAADDLKRQVDMIAPSYAIAVKGRAFPHARQGPRITVIRASSFAMANCFEIEVEAKRKKLRSAWYVDVRIARMVRQTKGSEWFLVGLLPTGRRRRIYTHDGYLWGQDLDTRGRASRRSHWAQSAKAGERVR